MGCTSSSPTQPSRPHQHRFTDATCILCGAQRNFASFRNGFCPVCLAPQPYFIRACEGCGQRCQHPPSVLRCASAEFAPKVPGPCPYQSREHEEILGRIQELADCLDPKRKRVPGKLKRCSNLNLRSSWSCPLCTFQNQPNAEVCAMCERKRDGTEKQIKQKSRNSGATKTPDVRVTLLESALDSISCPLCLDVFVSPVTLPCGHSLCARDAQRIDNGRCPMCRSAFTESQLARAANVSLARLVRAVVLLASLIDPDDGSTRDAAGRLGLSPQVTVARRLLEEQNEDDSERRVSEFESRLDQMAATLSERFRNMEHMAEKW